MIVIIFILITVVTILYYNYQNDVILLFIIMYTSDIWGKLKALYFNLYHYY